MTNIRGTYWQFYLEGRGNKRLLKHDIAESDLAERMVRDGVPFRETIAAACATAAKPLETSKMKTVWNAAHATAIKEAGGDAAAAYAAYLQGCADELAYAMEQDVIEALIAQFEDGEDGEDDEDEDETDEDEDKEDGETDEDDEDE